MSKSFLNTEPRDEIGSSRATHLRSSGYIPGVLYGGHMDPLPIKFEKNELEKFMASHNVGSKVYTKIDGKEVMTLLKTVQKDVFGNHILNVDLQALNKDDKVKLHVRLQYIGKDKLPTELLTQELVTELEIETLPEHLIDTITVDVSGMAVGDIIKASDLPISKDAKIKVITDQDLSLFHLAHRTTRSIDEIEDDAAEAAAEAETAAGEKK